MPRSLDIVVTHEVEFPAKHEYTGQIMQWCGENEIGYNFSKGSYIMKLNDREWIQFISFLILLESNEVE